MEAEDSAPIPVSVTGLDLSDPALIRLVRRIWYARFSARAERSGIDPDEGLSEVLLALVRKQRSARSMYDPARAGVTKYVYMVCGSILSHMVEARRCRPDLVLDDGRTDDEGDLRASPVDTAVAPDGVNLLDLVALQERVDEATDRTIPLGMLARLAGGQDARDAARDEGLDMFASAELVEAWRSFTAGGLGTVPEGDEGDVLDLFGGAS